jgi:hypothetical protein
MSYKTWKLEQETYENAFARRLLVEYNIKEVTTQRQAKNGTREFQFPVNNTRNKPLRLACFKSGYVRNQTACSSPYQLNPTYKTENRTVILSDKGLEVIKYKMIRRAKIWNQMARFNFILEFYLRNYIK